MFFAILGSPFFSIIEIALSAVSCQAVQVRFKQFKLSLVLVYGRNNVSMIVFGQFILSFSCCFTNLIVFTVTFIFFQFQPALFVRSL